MNFSFDQAMYIFVQVATVAFFIGGMWIMIRMMRQSLDELKTWLHQVADKVVDLDNRQTRQEAICGERHTGGKRDHAA